MPLPEHISAFFASKSSESRVGGAASSSLGTSLGWDTSLGRTLRRLNADEGAVVAMARVLGITSRLGSAFRCVLHPERKPSATLAQAADGVWLYHDWHATTRADEWLSL